MAAEIIATPLNLVKDYVVFNPLVTGPLLYVLTRGPDNAREALLNGVRLDTLASTLGTTNENVLAKSIKTLKWLVALGVFVKVNNFLSELALNHWRLRREGPPFDFQSGKEIICITGGSSGFGALMVKEFRQKTNAKIVVMDVQDLPKDLAALPNVHFYKCDLTQIQQVNQVTDAIKSEVGHPTVLINNAGIGKSGLILDTTPEWLDKIFRVNIMSHWQTVTAFLPAMLKAKKGHVVTMASMSTFVGVANIVDYSATKAGLLGFHEGLTQELRHRYENGRCIQTTIIHPHFAKTPLVTAGMSASGAGKGMESQLLKPETVSAKVVKQVLSCRSAQIFVPDDASRGAALRGYWTWFQEAIRDQVSKYTNA